VKRGSGFESYKRAQKRKAWLLRLLSVCAFAVLLLSPLVGSERIDLSVVLRPGAGDTAAVIFWRLRLPRVLTAFLAGAGLSLGGMAFQALFRNALATPFTLGVASGASLGAVLVLRFAVAAAALGAAAVTGGAFLGACGAVLIVYGLSRAAHGLSTAAMLLAGVAASFFFSSLILFVQYTSDFSESFRIVRWLMGGLPDVVGFEGAVRISVFVLTGALVLFFLRNELDIIASGEEIAASRGVDVPKLKRLLFFAVSLMVGGIVAVCGPIGFVGMMVPHMCRLMIGSGHRFLLPATFLFGGAFLTLCDTAARTVLAPALLPVGVITSFLGGPFFLWLLARKPPERVIG